MTSNLITITIQNPTPELLALLARTGGGNANPKYSKVAQIGDADMAEFMSGVSDKTEALLRIFAEHPTGEPSWSELMAAAGHDQWQQMRGFFAGLTKRVRTITRNNEANFYDLGSGPMRNDAANGDWEDNPIFLHPTTLQSLRTYFGVR